jgi:hypothetical protein
VKEELLLKKEEIIYLLGKDSFNLHESAAELL